MNTTTQQQNKFLGVAFLAVATLACTTAWAETNLLVVDVTKQLGTISRHIYGHFAEHLGRCIYEGVWVGPDSPIPNTRGIRNDVVEALRKIKVPVIRWPGGCFADEYHWKDGIGPRELRPARINTHWGGVIENNHFGTHEFLDLCEQVGADPYICGNVGSGTPQEMMEWVEYITSDSNSTLANLRRQNGREKPWRLPFFGIGNESWGCGGHMRPEYYADLCRRYATFVKNYSGNRVYKIACGATDWDTNWTAVVVRSARDQIHGISLHYYTLPTGNWSRKGSATRFNEDQWFSTLKRALDMDTIIARHKAILNELDPRNRIGLIVDEWGTWYDVEPGTNPGFLYQQNTLRDALVAGLTLNIFNKHCDRVKMANIAQMVNVLQAIILTDKEKMILTPTYHVFEMYTVHHDSTLLDTKLECETYGYGGQSIPALNVSASKSKDGAVNITICNFNPGKAIPLTCELKGFKPAKVNARVLTAPAMQAHNTFADPEVVKPAPFNDVKLTDSGFTAELPSKSVVVITLQE